MLLQIAYAQVVNILMNLLYSALNMISILQTTIFLVKEQLGNPDSVKISTIKSSFSVYIDFFDVNFKI